MRALFYRVVKKTFLMGFIQVILNPLPSILLPSLLSCQLNTTQVVATYASTLNCEVG